MYIEVGIPATLPLALVKLQQDGEEQLCLLAATLAHPPIHLRAEVSDSFTITGPRADVAVAYAQHLYDLTKPEKLTDIEIEYAIPVAMGLGSETMMGIGVAWAMKYFNAPSETDATTLSTHLGDGTNGLALWSSQNGGLLLLNLSERLASPLYRAELDSSEKDAWGVVTILPRVSIDLDEDEAATMEEDRYQALLNAAAKLDAQSGAIFTKELWPAVESDNLEAFGAALARLQSLTQEAMTAANSPSLLAEKHSDILQKMTQSGAAACGQSLTGYALYAFARGARSTINMRIELRDVVEYTDGVMDATFISPSGISVVEKEGSMKPVGTLLDKL